MRILEVDGVRVCFQNKIILKDVYLKVTQGEIVGVLGRNGSGKSTLFNVIFGELNTNEKSVRIDGITFRNNQRNPELIRYLPQYNFIPNHLTIQQVFHLFNLSYPEFLSVFKTFKLNPSDKIKNISSGEKRIIETYLILKSKTKFCILDEPFSQVAPKFIDIFIEMILEEKKHKGILISDHLYQNILNLSDNLYFLNQGILSPIKNKEELIQKGYIRS